MDARMVMPVNPLHRRRKQGGGGGLWDDGNPPRNTRGKKKSLAHSKKKNRCYKLEGNWIETAKPDHPHPILCRQNRFPKRESKGGKKKSEPRTRDVKWGGGTRQRQTGSLYQETVPRQSRGKDLSRNVRGMVPSKEAKRTTPTREGLRNSRGKPGLAQNETEGG